MKKITISILAGLSVFMIFYGGAIDDKLICCAGAGLMVTTFSLYSLNL